jgi:phage portal protein BeeE
MSNALAEATEARQLANLLVDQEHRRVKDRDRARRNVARAIGTSPGTIENLQRNRLKRIAGWLRDALRARVIRELEAEIARLQHELAVHKQIGMDPRGDEAAAVRADLSAILTVLGRDR